MGKEILIILPRILGKEVGVIVGINRENLVGKGTRKIALAEES